jgi:hypothetical protein
MESEGIEYVWVTDGRAWERNLQKILGDAYLDHPNLYNLHMVQTELEQDLKAFLEQGSVNISREDLDPQSGLSDFY